MTGLPLILVFILAIILMIIMISKFKIHPFISIMLISLVLGIVAGIPIVDKTLEDGTTVSGLASVIGAGFSGTFSSIGIVIILGALIGSILEVTGAALKLADMVILSGNPYAISAADIGKLRVEKLMDKLGLSARAYSRILKVARTIADLEGTESIEPQFLSEAASYRFLDRIEGL